MNDEEIRTLSGAIRDALATTWGDARIAGSAESEGGVWDVAVAQGWVGMLSAGALDGVVAAVRELGRVACPLPLMEAAVATQLLGESDGADIVEGRVRPLLIFQEPVGDRIRNLDGARAATHVLVVGEAGAALRPIVDVVAAPGLAAPAWSHARLGAAVSIHALTSDQIACAASLVRLGLAVRAQGAVARSHELALEFTRTRQQFGRVIGAFQAVQHRAVNAQMSVTTAEALTREAVRLHDLGDPAWQLAAEITVEYARQTVPDIQFAAHHTLAANGYFEEHEAPWLFRRAHADLLQQRQVPSPMGEVADALLDCSQQLPRMDLGAEAEQFRADVMAFLAANPTDESAGVMDHDDVLTKAAADAGLIGIGWPAAHGGRDASVEQQVVLNEELGYRRAPLTAPMAAADILGNAIIRHGTPEQQQRFIPQIRAGKLSFYLGYSEPEVGSDLASLTTTARRDGDGWVIDGTKMWGTMADRAEYVWLAARTDPDAPKHAGLTVFLFETGLPGWSKQEHRALSGEVSCTTVFDGVRIPDTARVGEVNGGWAVIVDALLSERLTMAGHVARTHRRLDELVDVLRARPEISQPGSAVRATLSSLATRVQGARALVLESVVGAALGRGLGVETSMAKIVASELAEDLGVAALDVLGPDAALADNRQGGILGGGFSDDLRLSIMHVVGGGTNDIQRNLIARAMGMGR